MYADSTEICKYQLKRMYLVPIIMFYLNLHRYNCIKNITTKFEYGQYKFLHFFVQGIYQLIIVFEMFK